ncbi:MAG TPA: class I SAM-dependent methyltransferase [Myxococcota bacterium]|jgi:SAM-dependent methyltransferase|nr:class I SAM-dependent methyltransferase [Myxococcota bacterium]
MQTHTYEIERQVQERHWWFRVRRRLVAETIAGLDLPPAGEARALDLGCGSGSHGPVLARVARVAGCDRSAEAFREAPHGAYAWRLRCDALRLPVRDASVDLVLAADLLEHLDDDREGLAEVRRVLRPGGWGLFLVPAFGWLWGVQDDVSEHRRRYTGALLRGRVEEAGLTVARATYFNTFLLPPIFLARYFMRRTGMKVESENELTPGWTNGLLERVFGLEVPLLRRIDLPVGVSFLCLARKT